MSWFNSKQSKFKFIFLFSLALVYIGLFHWLDGLRFLFWDDEGHFWITSLIFSKGIIASFDQLHRYQELNTPLPFVIYGLLEYCFHGGIFVGRLFNFALSIGMTTMIGWPTREKGERALLSVLGLLLCPYYLWLSGHLYTDIIASFFVLLGFWFYIHERHLLSCIAFVLAISSRQYMLAFPLAILTFELTSLFQDENPNLRSARHWRWVAQLVAAASILGWFLLFKGLAPEAAMATGRPPTVQQSLMALAPNGGLYFLSVVGLYFVMPEYLLFRQELRSKMSFSRRVWLGALLLLVLFLIFPPPSGVYGAAGFLYRMGEAMPTYLKFGLFYVLALVTCIRFSRINIAFWVLLFNGLIMLKAHPWDRYALPLIISFWYLKSINLLEATSVSQLLGIRQKA